MVIQITRREVLNNLIRFKDNLLEMRGDPHRERGREGKKEGRTYKVLLNRHTGDMRFAQKISNLERHFHRREKANGNAADWKEIHLIVDHKNPQNGVHFDVLDAHDHALKPSDVDPLAWRIARETLDVLNLKGEEVKHTHIGMLPEEEVLQDLSSIHLTIQRERIEDLSGWCGPLSRIEAEKRLAKKKVGTYILRDADETTRAIAFHLSETNFMSVQPYLLTVVDKEQKISDLLLLQTDMGWIVYDDDPILKGPSYSYHSSPQDLLHTLHNRARYPISQ